MNRRRELFFGREGHEAKNREFLCQYLNRPPFNRKDQQEYRQLSPENASPPRRNFDFTENSGVRPKRKSSRRMDYYQPFQHIAYIERIRKVQNLERERRARSTSPRLPRIVHLQNNTSLNVKKIENHWKNLQIKRALQNEIEETKELKNEIADNDSRTFEEPKQSQKLLMDGNIDTISTLKIVDDLIESEEATEEKLKNDQNAISYFSKESKNAARRCKSTSSIKTVKQFKIAEGPTSTHYRSRPKPPHRPPGKGLMLIESIKRMVMYNSNDRNDNTDEDDSGWSEDVTMKFPKETRNAVAFMLNKSKESPPSVPLQNSETQTSPTGSKINMADQYDDNKKIPCPKDILCAKGLHAGECSRSSRTKNLIVHRKETWPGRAFRVTEETPVVSVKDLTRDKKESFLSLMEPLRVSVKEAVEKLEPLLNGKRKSCLS